MITINIVNGSNTTAWTPSGDITLSAGLHASYAVDAPNKKVRAVCDLQDGWISDFYGSTRDCIENQTNGSLNNAGSPFYVDFRPGQGESRKGYYISRIGGVSGILGRFDIVGGSNFRWAPATAGLTIADMSRPDVDCLDYLRIAGYLTRINELADRIAVDISGTPSGDASNPAVYGLWKQYQALREMWNYLVVRNLVVFSMEHQGNKLFVKARFSNPSASALSVGNLMVGFAPCSYNGLFYKAWSTDSNGTGLDWTTSSAKFQNMSTGSWTLAPSSSCSVAGGGYIEVTAVFFVFSTTLTALTRKISRDIAPWVDKLPSVADGKVTSAGWLSWDRTHFNPTTYGSVTPSGLPPAGDGCTLKRSTGDVTAAWITNGSIQSTRPALHIDYYCEADKASCSFSDFTGTVTPETVDPNGAFSLSGSGTTSTLIWTPTGGSAVNVLSLSFNGRHFHQGDHIFLDIPEGWGTDISMTSFKLSCVWDIPLNDCIVDASRAGGRQWAWIKPVSHDPKTVPARNGSNDYEVEKIRSIVLDNSN